VTALVRDKTSFASTTAADGTLTIVTIVKAQLQDKAEVGKAFVAAAGETPDAIIVALNSVRTSDSPFAKQTSPPALMRDAL
jgi:hypothetical protein